MTDLAFMVQSTDHTFGRSTALVTLVEYTDFASDRCRQMAPIIKTLIQEFGSNLRYVFRHFPQSVKSDDTELAAEAVEAAAVQGRFWSMHDLLFSRQDDLSPNALVRYAASLGLNLDVFARDLVTRTHRPRIAQDLATGLASGVNDAPTLFVNGHRYSGPLTYDALKRYVERRIGRHAEVLYSE